MMVAESSLLEIVFMPLVLMDQKQKNELYDSQPAMFYSFMEDAFPSCVNGYPVFSTVYSLTNDEAREVHRIYRELQVKLREKLDA